MILYYLLIISLPLVEHAVLARQVGGTPRARAFLAFCLRVVACYVLHGHGLAGAGTGALGAYTSYRAVFVTTLILVDSLERLRRVLLVAVGAMAFASLYVLREWQ